jgi:hypothetical protein
MDYDLCEACDKKNDEAIRRPGIRVLIHERDHLFVKYRPPEEARNPSTGF